MAISERVQVLMPPELHRKLRERAREDGKSLGQLLRELGEREVERASRTEGLWIVEQMRRMELPVGSVDEMNEEALRGRLEG